jgi:hypothetical protein
LPVVLISLWVKRGTKQPGDCGITSAHLRAAIIKPNAQYQSNSEFQAQEV